mmetsp:Transcript_11249/g.17253  ORF Transcript_11249/g.17253 Transcript_11249/m.17253 type:complete len:197 (-) Transcript_11249:172-762(-)
MHLFHHTMNQINIKSTDERRLDSHESSVSPPRIKQSNEHQQCPSTYKREMSKPIKFRVKPSLADIQLHEDEQAAEYRDYCMYMRLVCGMKDPRRRNNQSLANVIRTRHAYHNISEPEYDCDWDNDENDESSSSDASVEEDPQLLHREFHKANTRFAINPLKYQSMVQTRNEVLSNIGNRSESSERCTEEAIFDMDL